MESLQSLMAGDGGTNLLVIAIAGAIGMLVVVIGMLALDGSDRRKTNRRVQRVKNAGKSNRVSADAVNIKRSTAFSSNKVLDEMIRRLLPQPENLRTKLTRTGLSITPGKYLAANLVVAILAFFGFQTMPFIPTAGVVLLAIFVGAGLPYLTITFLANRRRNKFIANFPEAIDLMVRGLKSGLPITETLKVLGEEMEDPISTEFQAVTDAIKFGKKMDDALWDMSKRLDVAEFNFFTVTLAIQSETGGNLAETLENLSDVLRRRRQMKLKIRALAAEPKSSAYIIGSLPFIMFALIYVMNNGYVMKLFTDPRGWMALAVGGGMFLTGIAVMVRMVRFEI